jgi:hypothetical protein
MSSRPNLNTVIVSERICSYFLYCAAALLAAVGAILPNLVGSLPASKRDHRPHCLPFRYVRSGTRSSRTVFFECLHTEEPVRLHPESRNGDVGHSTNVLCASEYFLGAGLGAARRVRMAPSLM